MANKKEKEKQMQDKLQIILADLLKDDDNKYCVDCDSKGPRWASWTLGIFLCIRCAGIHRNLGVHLSRVKSVNLDSWTPQQVAMMKEIGNSRGRAIYEANLEDNFRRPQTDSALEQFIRAKYEHKRYIAKEWIAPTPTVDSIAEEIRKLDQNQNKKRVNYNVNSAANNVIIPISRQYNSEQSTNSIKTTENDDKSRNISNKVDLLGLENDNVPNNIDDTFGDFVFASQQPPPTNQTVNGCGVSTPAVSSAVDDLMGLNLGNSGQVPSVYATGINATQNLSTSTPSVPNVGGKLDKSSILALYNNNNTGSVGGQMTNSSGWPSGAGSSSYQSGVMQPDFQSQGYGKGPNWMMPGQLNSTSGFGVQHNPFFNNSVFPGQQSISISQNAFASSVTNSSTQPSNSMFW